MSERYEKGATDRGGGKYIPPARGLRQAGSRRHGRTGTARRYARIGSRR